MNTARLADMLSSAVAFDTETHLSQPGLAAPPMVCASIAQWSDGRIRGLLLDKEGARLVFAALLGIPHSGIDYQGSNAAEFVKMRDATIIGAFIAFDMIVMAADYARRGQDVLPYIFAAYQAGRVFDVQLAEALHAIALGMLGYDPRSGKKLTDPETKKQGRYSLSIVTDLVHNEKTAKANDRFRKSYALLEHIPIREWPPEAQEYPVDDAVNTFKDGVAQAGLIPNTGAHDFATTLKCSRCGSEPGTSPLCVSTFQRRNIHDLSTQCYTHFAMALGAAWGLIPDPASVAKLKHEAMRDLAEEIKPFKEAGIIREDGTENQAVLKRIVAEAYGSVNPCPACAGTVIPSGRQKGQPAPGKVPSPKTGGKTLINCEACDGTALELSKNVPRSEGGGVSKARDPLSESGNELAMSYAAYGEDAKISNVYVPFLESGVIPQYRLEIPDGATAAEVDRLLEICLADIERAMALGMRITIPITLRPNPLLETNRASYDGVIQLLPRDGGVRECFIARPGMVYYSNDYGGLELATWSQICLWMFGRSELAKAINGGVNVHGALGATMAGIPYDELMRRIAAGDKAAKDFRGAAKWGNFGFMGGMAELKLVHQVRQQGSDTEHPTGPVVRKGKRVYRGQRFCIMIGGAPRCGEKMINIYGKQECPPTCAKCIECSKWIKEKWSKQWPESAEYFKAIKKIADQGWQKHPISNRVRGGIGFCDGANGYFQELAAQGAKDALRHVVREQWDSSYTPEDLGHRSVLYENSKTIVFAHDELIGESRIDVGHEVGERVSTVMEARMKIYVPDVKITVEPTLMPRWYKAAACVRDASGRLQPWMPKAKAA